MKQVKVLKKKHRNAMWSDNVGDVWFYSLKDNSWAVLMGYSDEPMGVDNHVLLNPGELHGPFKRVLRFDRYA